MSAVVVALADEHPALHGRAASVARKLEARAKWLRGEIEDPDGLFIQIVRDDHGVCITPDAVNAAWQRHSCEAAE